MDHDTAHTTAIDTLETLGFNHYEAACFTALTRLSHGTAKELSELTDVALTETFETVPDATVRCKQVAASSGTTRLPLIWIDSSEQSALRDALAHDPTVTTADRLVDTGQARLYRMRWAPPMQVVLQLLTPETTPYWMPLAQPAAGSSASAIPIARRSERPTSAVKSGLCRSTSTRSAPSMATASPRSGGPTRNTKRSHMRMNAAISPSHVRSLSMS